MIIYLESPSPTTSSDPPLNPESGKMPKTASRASSLFKIGLASDGVYTAANVTICTVVSYTAISPLQRKAFAV